MYLYAEARGLVRSLLQPDPTLRLTAGQTLLHPWVEAKAAVCQQEAPKDKTQANAVNNTAEQDRLQRLHQNNASEKIDFTKKEPIRPLEGIPGVQTPDCSHTCSPSREVNWPEILDQAHEVSNTAWNAGKQMYLRNYLSGPITQLDPLPQIKSQSQQNSQGHLTPHTQASTNHRQTVSSPLVSTHPSTKLATASSSQSSHQQNSRSSLHNRNSPTVHKADWWNAFSMKGPDESRKPVITNAS